MTTPTHMILIETEALSDGSEAFNVILPGTRTSIPARDRNAAEAMAVAICEAINDGSNDTADVIYD